MIAHWLDQRRRTRDEARDEATYMLRDHGAGAEQAIDRELALVPAPCQRRTMLRQAKRQLTFQRRRQQRKTV